MNAPVDVLAAIDDEITRNASYASCRYCGCKKLRDGTCEDEDCRAAGERLVAARVAIVHLMAAAESAIVIHARVNTATVAGRRELGPCVRHLRAMLEKAGRRVVGVR